MSTDSKLSAAALHHRPLTLAGLRGFEASARHLSLTRAASELNLTQSAISRQVQSLEDEFGVALFVRKAREILLTPEGAQFLPTVQRVLAELDASVERLRRDAFSPRIAVNTFASFASLWLIPRLTGFRAIKPNVDIDVGATDRLVDIELENIDVAIRYLRHDS
ncbi:MAG: LysR family transcriptional regulator, partial [Casimicrobium sp.]